MCIQFTRQIYWYFFWLEILTDQIDWYFSWLKVLTVLFVVDFDLTKYKSIGKSHGLRTSNEGINLRNLKFWANVADNICLSST